MLLTLKFQWFPLSGVTTCTQQETLKIVDGVRLGPQKLNLWVVQNQIQFCVTV